MNLLFLTIGSSFCLCVDQIVRQLTEHTQKTQFDNFQLCISVDQKRFSFLNMGHNFRTLTAVDIAHTQNIFDSFASASRHSVLAVISLLQRFTTPFCWGVMGSLKIFFTWDSFQNLLITFDESSPLLSVNRHSGAFCWNCWSHKLLKLQ